MENKIIDKGELREQAMKELLTIREAQSYINKQIDGFLKRNKTYKDNYPVFTKDEIDYFLDLE